MQLVCAIFHASILVFMQVFMADMHDYPNI